MGYCIRKETILRVGTADSQGALQTLRVFDTREEALSDIHRRRELLSRCRGELFGSKDDFHAVLRSGGDRSVLVHYWVEEKTGGDRTLFELDASQTRRLKGFVAEHRRHGRSGSAGEFLQVSFIPTLLGTCSSARCLVCGSELELTDADSW